MAGRDQNKFAFEAFFRQSPFGSTYTVAAGLEQALQYLSGLSFKEDEIAYLSRQPGFHRDFLNALAEFRFQGDVYAIPEGRVVYPREPLIRVEGTIWECQLVETALLAIIGHQTLIATKAARVCEAAGDDPVMEFGARRCQGMEAAFLGARAAFIGGCGATSNVLAGQRFGIPVAGTMAHSFIMSFASELEAFRAYAQAFPNKAVFLVDTYETLNSGVPNAIKVWQEWRDKGMELQGKGIRLDSGDLAYLSKRARKMMDEAGFPEAVIVGSNDLDEYLIRDIKGQGAPIGLWGVGTRLMTAADQPALGLVYKLVAELKEEQSGIQRWEPRVKKSEVPEKVTLAGRKQVFRFLNQENQGQVHSVKNGIGTKSMADLITLWDEPEPKGEVLIFDPVHTWKRKILRRYEVEKLVIPVMRQGRRLLESEDLSVIRSRAKKDIAALSEEQRRIVNPHGYIVDWSKELWTTQQQLLNSTSTC